ncbi:MAG: response regulator [Deltaproteobacteria bacterium]|jgi:signal transduction histidine kinase/CheY-like chemotaxis protein|nr:response regulator [Deltaproteobacteria bacterium]
MKDQEKTRQQLIRELMELREQAWQLESQHRHARKELRESQQQLQQAQKMETLGTLVAGVAHEINNPINLIMYNLPLIEKIWSDFLPLLIERKKNHPDEKFGGFTHEFLEDNLSQLVADMDMAANRVAKIVSDLKNFSKQSNVAEKTSLQVNTAVKNALRLAQATLRTSGVKIELELDENLPEMEGNLQSIEQIILNICINAIQAIDHDNGIIRIRTEFEIKNGRILIAISDNGSGISPAIVDTLFLPFVTDKKDQGGTGLGLSVTYGLVQAHGGDITFDTRQGQGTTFTISLPTALKGESAKILIVDDDQTIRAMLTEALMLNRSRTFLIQEASNGIEASIKLGTFRPDLLILDIFMPEMDGLEVCRIIKNEPELSDMKVLISTGYPDHTKLDIIAKLGFDNVIYKPFDLAEFVKKVETILAAD